MPPLDVLVPWRPSTQAREAALRLVESHLAVVFPDAAVRRCDDPAPQFNRGRALNAGMAATSAPVVVWADADLLVAADSLTTAVELAVDGAPLVVPFASLRGLSENATRQVVAGADPWGPWTLDLDWTSRSTGGCNVLPRSTWEATGGFDGRFSGWGFEDAAFAAAVETLAGPISWLPGPAVHLWHPHDPTRHSGLYDLNAALCAQYNAAHGDVDAMRQLTGVTP